MTWTYGADPANSVIDEVHFLVGDTDAAEQLIQNEEINYHLQMWPKAPGWPAYLAAASVADAIAAQFARRADRSIGALSIQAKQQRDHYVELAQTLRELYRTGGLGEDPTPDVQSFGSVVAGVPVLGGGGTTVLGV